MIIGETMIRPYEGDEGYLFISYSHRDMDEVMPIIAKLNEFGYNIWYDEGIDPGTEWADTIALHIEKCSIFVAFLTESFVGSQNCLDELDYAREKGVKQILIFLKELELTRGLAMRTNRIQAIYKFRYKDENQFFTRFNDTDEVIKLRKAQPEMGEGQSVKHPGADSPIHQTVSAQKPKFETAAIHSESKSTGSNPQPNRKMIFAAWGADSGWNRGFLLF